MIANDFLWNLYPDDSITKHIQKHNVWEPHIIKFMRKFIKPTYNCYDLGACFGWHTLEMARNTKFGKVIAFEPHKPAMNLLKINIIQNNIQNIIVIDRAIGDKICSSFLVNAYNKNNINIGDSFVNHTYDIHDTVYKNNEKLDVNGVPINIITLDSFYDITGIEPDFMKIDIQGFELFALQGGKKMIEKCKPCIAIEVEDQCSYQNGYTPKILFDYIWSINYEIFYLESDYPCDHICIHKDKLDDFMYTFGKYIKTHIENNLINNNYEFGIRRKICL